MKDLLTIVPTAHSILKTQFHHKKAKRIVDQGRAGNKVEHRHSYKVKVFKALCLE